MDSRSATTRRTPPPRPAAACHTRPTKNKAAGWRRVSAASSPRDCTDENCIPCRRLSLIVLTLTSAPVYSSRRPDGPTTVRLDVFTGRAASDADVAAAAACCRALCLCLNAAPADRQVAVEWSQSGTCNITCTTSDLHRDSLCSLLFHRVAFPICEKALLLGLLSTAVGSLKCFGGALLLFGLLFAKFLDPKRAPDGHECCCCCCCCCWGFCYQIFDLLRPFYFTTDRHQTLHTDWWQSHRDGFSS